MPEGGQHIADELLNPFLDRIANNEITVALSGIFLTNPRRYFTRATLLEAFEEYQGSPFTERYVGENLIALCKRNLEGADGILEDGPDGLKIQSGFRMERLALAGLICDWSFRWQNFSVQQVYGAAKSKIQGPSTTIHSPSARHGLYKILHEQEMSGLPVSVPELSGRLDIGIKSISSLVARLVEIGLLSKGSATGSKRKQTDVRLAAAAREPIQELVSGIDLLQQGGNRAFYAQRCRTIIGHVQTFSALVAKGEAWSPLKDRAERNKAKEYILPTIRDHPDGLTAKAAQKILAEAHPKATWSVAYMRTLLGRFVQSGHLGAREEWESSSSKRLVKVYYALETPPAQQHDHTSGKDE